MPTDLCDPPGHIRLGDVETTLAIVGWLAKCDEAALLSRVAAARRAPTREAPERHVAMVTVALLKSVRLLNLSAGGPTRVSELPLVAVQHTIGICAGADHGEEWTLGGWLTKTDLGGWIIDAPAWQRRLAKARVAARWLDADSAFALCAGRLVVASRACELDAGPFDGSPAVVVILEDGTMLTIAAESAQDATGLLNARVSAAGPRGWCFEDARENRACLRCPGDASVLVQRSPAAAGSPARTYL